MNLEYCCKCGEPTGRAGRGDDSLYTEDAGPFCVECYPNNEHEMTTTKESEYPALPRDEVAKLATEAARSSDSRLLGCGMDDLMRFAELIRAPLLDEIERLKAELGDLPEAQAELLTLLKEARAAIERQRGVMQKALDAARDAHKVLVGYPINISAKTCEAITALQSELEKKS